jgi:hypothetical protein
MSAVSFAINTNCLLVGDSEGQVSILQLRGMPTPAVNQVKNKSHSTDRYPMDACFGVVFNNGLSLVSAASVGACMKVAIESAVNIVGLRRVEKYAPVRSCVVLYRVGWTLRAKPSSLTFVLYWNTTA